LKYWFLDSSQYPLSTTADLMKKKTIQKWFNLHLLWNIYSAEILNLEETNWIGVFQKCLHISSGNWYSNLKYRFQYILYRASPHVFLNLLSLFSSKRTSFNFTCTFVGNYDHSFRWAFQIVQNKGSRNSASGKQALACSKCDREYLEPELVNKIVFH